MTGDDATATEESFSTLVIWRRPWLSAATALAATLTTGFVVLGAIVAVNLSGPTLIRGVDGVSILEWAPPLAVWQWLIAGAIEFALIGIAAAAWWGAWSAWGGRRYPDLTLPSPLPFLLAGAVAMIGASALALVTHVRNWREWHALVVEHPEWGETAQAWQVPVGAGLAVLIVGGLVAGTVFLWRRNPRT